MEAIIALLALTLMEIVLGIDNIIFITILTDRLPEEQQPLARRLGLGLAMISRIALLSVISYVIRLKSGLFTLTALGIPSGWLQALVGEDFAVVNEVSGRDIILLLGGLFLIRHSVKEIHEQLEGEPDVDADLAAGRTFTGVLINITVMDIIFSLDSVITAVGMTENLYVMVTAVVLSVIVMMVFAERISRFVKKHPTLKMLALSFLILIGVMLVAEAAGTHVNKGYIYFAMAFSLIVEALNIRLRSSQENGQRTAEQATSSSSDLPSEQDT
jgi:predicted tellurium resistance membrane protein TerC